MEICQKSSISMIKINYMLKIYMPLIMTITY